MPGPNVLAVVVAHASRTRLTQVLESLREQSYEDVETVVAAVGDLRIPEGFSPAVVEVREQAGFAEAINHVMATVALDDIDYVLLLHDDVSLDPDVVERLVATAGSDGAIAAVGAKLLEWYEPDVMQEVGAAVDRFAIRRSALDVGEVDAGQRDETSDVLFCSDACLLVRRDALVEIGGMDAKAWPFYEDVDLCWRFRARGARVVVDPSARVRHAADLSQGRRLFSVLALSEHAEHGRLRFMLKHYAPLGLAVLLPQIFVASLARMVGALARRELWRIRVIVGAWARTITELGGIISDRRRLPRAPVEDRELLALAARGAVGDVRGQRAEWASRLLASIGRPAERAAIVARQPVTWFAVLAIGIVLVVLRDVVFSGTFALGELRALEPFGDAVADHFGTVRREGLDPFGPAGPGLIILGIVRSLLRSAALAEKVVLVGPVVLAGFAGARAGRALAFGPVARRWLAVVAAVNPVTLSLLRDGSVGALAMWAASLWLFAHMYAPVPLGEGLQAQVRFVAQWAFGWTVTVALHPPSFVFMCVLGLILIVARRERPTIVDGVETLGSTADRTTDRLRILISGAAGSTILLLPWSAEWFTLRSPLFGRPGWLVHATGGGLDRASLGAGWPLVAWLVIAVAAAFFVGLDRTSFSLAVLSGVAVLAGATTAFPRESMLVASAVCSFLVLAIAARHIVEEMPRYEFGVRQSAVIMSVVAFGAIWIGAAFQGVPDGARVRAIPVIAGVRSSETGRVLWLAETTSGVRSWSTLSFSGRLGAFPAPGGPEERLATKAIEAARAGRTHRLGAILALADVSHIVALDEASRKGLSAQADIAPQEEQGAATVFRNDGWRGPAMLLAAPPSEPLSPAGLADVAKDPRRIALSGWPYGPISLSPRALDAALNEGDRDERASSDAVVYVAGGRRGGLRIEGASARLAAAGAFVPRSDVRGAIDVGVPGRWWRWMLPLEALLIIALLAGWLTAAYIGAPMPAAPVISPDLLPLTARPVAIAVAPVLLVAGLLLGWSGVVWGVGTPFLSSAWYCPPIGREYVQRIGIVNPNRGRVEYQVRSDLESPPKTATSIAGRSRHTLEISPRQGAVIESYGRRLVVATEVERRGDHDASLCTAEARTVNIFPEGGRAATLAVPRLFERYVIYNPFPDLARASVRFLSPDEPISPPALQDVQVKPGAALLIDPEDQFEPMLDLSTVVRVWQGRAIVARRLRTIEQVSFSLAVDEITEGFLPRATTVDAATNLIVVNRDEDPAHVTLYGAGRTGSLPEETFDIPEDGRADFKVTTIAPRAKDLVIGVEADRSVAMESLVATDDRAAVSLIPPLPTARRWVLPIAEGRELLLTNPTTRRVRVRLIRLGPGGEIADVSIDANRVAHVKLRGRSAFGVLVESLGGSVTAAAIGPAGSTPGVPTD